MASHSRPKARATMSLECHKDALKVPIPIVDPLGRNSDKLNCVWRVPNSHELSSLLKAHNSVIGALSVFSLISTPIAQSSDFNGLISLIKEPFPFTYSSTVVSTLKLSSRSRNAFSHVFIILHHFNWLLSFLEDCGFREDALGFLVAAPSFVSNSTFHFHLLCWRRCFPRQSDFLSEWVAPTIPR